MAACQRIELVTVSEGWALCLIRRADLVKRADMAERMEMIELYESRGMTREDAATDIQTFARCE